MSESRGIRRALIVLALLAALVGGLVMPASAQTYPIDSFLSMFDGPVADATDPRTRNFNFEEGVLGAIRRILMRYPAHYGNPELDPAHEAQVAFDSALHMRPQLPYDHAGDVGLAAYTPDWDHDGAFGDGGGTDPTSGSGDFDADTDEVLDTAYFLMPCLSAQEPYPVHYRYTNGTCDVGNEQTLPYVAGVAQEVRFVNARGLVLEGTLWLPPRAFVGLGCPVPGTKAYAVPGTWAGCVSRSNLTRDRLPGIVWAAGLASRQEHYFWIAQRLAWAGYVVLTYDPAGQGESEGSTLDLLNPVEFAAPQTCRYPGSCQDLEDAVRWFMRIPVTPVDVATPRLEARVDPRNGPPNPVAFLVDRRRVGIGGHSMGGATVHSYLRSLAAGAGVDGRPVPKVAAAVSLSYSAPVTAVVPLQLQTSDYDGVPFGFTVLQANAQAMGEGLGYQRHKEGYDAIRAGPGRRPVSLIVLEGGTHTDFINQPFIYKTPWAHFVAGHYAQAWFDCHVLGSRAACVTGTRPIPHLSRSFASEQDPDGPGPRPSRCIAVPDQWSLAQDPQSLVTAATGAAPYDCATGRG